MKFDIFNLRYIINNGEVSFFGYRKARPKVMLVSFERRDRMIKLLEDRLYKVTGKQRDNHVLFEVKFDEYTLAVQFTDDLMILGLGVDEQKW